MILSAFKSIGTYILTLSSGKIPPCAIVFPEAAFLFVLLTHSNLVPKNPSRLCKEPFLVSDVYLSYDASIISPFQLFKPIAVLLYMNILYNPDSDNINQY